MIVSNSSSAVLKKNAIPDLLDTGWSFQNSWGHGPLYVLEKMWADLRIDKIIRDKAGELFERTIFLMVANRCLAPQSKLGCYEHRLEEIYWRLADLLSLDVDLVFYDTTSVHFEIAPQMIVGMAVTRDGFSVKSWVFPGNTADVTTIERVKEDLKGRRLNRCVFVADAGMVSEENLALLRRGGGRYIEAMPWRRGADAAEAVSHPGRFQEVRENLQIKEVRLGGRRYVVCFNPKEAERQ